MNKTSIQFENIDLNLPVELVAFQYDLELPTFLVAVEDIKSIILNRGQAKAFLDWLFEGYTANYWTQYISDGERCYVDINCRRSNPI